MRINLLLVLSSLLLVLPAQTFASGEHSSTIYHAFKLQTDDGKGHDNNSITRWDLDGWIGGDDNKLWLKSEGERVTQNTESSEIWALYSRNIDTFWDAQIGVRYDMKPVATSYLAFGFMGLAPYFFETEAHFFVSDEGDVSFRLREENDFLITQKLIIKPYIEANLFAQAVAEQNTGSGLSNSELGVKLRYEITRNIAPYLDLRYEKLYGDTARIATNQGERSSDVVVGLGVQLMF